MRRQKVQGKCLGRALTEESLADAVNFLPACRVWGTSKNHCNSGMLSAPDFDVNLMIKTSLFAEQECEA